MKWIISKRDLDAIRLELESLKRQRLEADISADIRFKGMQNLFALERELLQEYAKAQREDVREQCAHETASALRQFSSLKLSLLQELQNLRTQVETELTQLREQTRVELRGITERAKDEQNALKSRLLGSLASLAPAGDIQRACAHEWPDEWSLSPDAKHESQQCLLCDLWRIRYSELWTQHHPQDHESIRFSVVKSE